MMTFVKTIGTVGCAIFVTTFAVNGGDAVGVGYNAEGVWTTVTYYCSSSPKGGKDYKDEAQAREAVTRDLRRLDGAKLARTEILSSSDSTGLVAVARGETTAGKDLTVVARGKSQAEADAKAMADLNRQGATAKQKIVYRYFSHGSQ